ncbi:hypothetical protein SprV_0501737900 [Sparganum proliferum]
MPPIRFLPESCGEGVQWLKNKSGRDVTVDFRENVSIGLHPGSRRHPADESGHLICSIALCFEVYVIYCFADSYTVHGLISMHIHLLVLFLFVDIAVVVVDSP